MAKLAVKRVYDPPAPGDGKRILVDRLWPRGLRRDAAALDAWVKDVAPTDDLRRWFGHRPERFAAFRERYRAELADNPALDVLRSEIGRAKATLLYAAKDPAHNQAIVLAELLNERGGARKPA
jgi:uncharacterized protein YeaO (DUF488 family)